MADGTFIHLTAAELATLRTNWLACLNAIAANQSYQIAGRSLTRANLGEVEKIIGEITYAQNLQSGNLQRFVRADMSSND